MNIALVGFMGTGKTYVGRALAGKLGVEFVDSDDVIEERSGMKISAIFEQFGEQYFRELEKKAIKELSERDGLVIACGGGVVLNQENVDNLKRNGIVICLTATPEAIYRRVKDESHRPLLQVEDPMGKIKELLERRAKYYAQADYTIDASEMSIDENVEEIERILGEREK